MPALFPPNLGFGQNPSPVPQHSQDGGRAFDYNTDSYNTNTRLPGLGVQSAAGPLVPPPPFTFMPPFPSTQFPHPPFPPLQMPPLRYPSIPVPPVHGYEPVRHTTSDYPLNTAMPTPPGPQPAVDANSESDPDREEGELTDREESSSTQPRPHKMNSGQQSGPSFDTPMSRAMDGSNDFMESDRTMKPNGTGHHDSHNSHPEVERGGASPETRLSSRSSGSPYNPAPPSSTEAPIPNNALGPELPAPSIPQYEAAPGKEVSSAAPTEPQTTPSGGRSLAQLRVQAQGALLSLAPHNIRYAEFVGEGINPVILRQLYEEVGIKIATPIQDVSTPPSSATSLESDRSSTSQSAEVEQGNHSLPKLDANQSSAPPSKPTDLPPDTTKPMERKEVIARMLAAKAAKGSGASGQVQAQAAKETSSSEDSVLPDADKNATTRSQDGEIKEKEIRVKEKNKAQTELARQRIELLKKQGLMRNGQKSQSDSVPPEKPQPSINSGTELSSTSTPMPIQHPLPERPPDPEPNAPARIPGLFMTEQEPDTVPNPVTATQGAPNAVSQTRVNQRKRPRASDFDEPVPIPKKTFNNGGNQIYPDTQRLIIDISDDDEFYGDDEHDNMDVDTPAGKDVQDVEGLLRTYTPSVDILPQRPATASSQGFSASATPQSLRNNDQEHQEHLRRKDLEIKAMHKRIAELEERKKAKLAASRTQSPRPSDVSEPSPPTNKLLSDDVSKASKLPAEAEQGDKFLANLDHSQVESIKAKLLRKQEIEAGIPALDAEIHKSEAKLAGVKDEETRLLSEITKGREGRRQLLDELNNLKMELNGLTFDDVEAAIRRAQDKDDKEARERARQQRSSGNESMTPELMHAGLPVEKEPENKESPRQSVVSEEVPEPQSGNGSSIVPDDKVMDDVGESSGELSSSDSTGSAMDESSDSSSDESLDEEELPAHTPVPEANAPGEPGESAEDEQPEPTEAEADFHHDLPERPRTLDAELQAEPAADERVTEDQGQASRESSVSDAYEPPEPEETASPADSSYSPPFSPASPDPVDALEVSMADETRQADEPLTRKVQELDTQQPSAYAQVGILDNPRVPEQAEHKFSPYVSPLKNFKAYRYHPNFTENVSGGYRSLTYSHNIDPMRYLCPFESSGGVCNDRSCEFQHFRDMTLSDDKILVQMGSLREGKTPEEKDEYIAGLKQIINDMRRDKVKDFNTVATEIAAYRRRFLQDPSRVLPL
ncbi:hypothetical protein ASPBRDRAFT_54372 [Aspergillus brasiliensis CBS 101740]|uniref:Putative zinc-finger domain-containing protein n=1 Tax=Aspergillus brasiliensis (strain CBS 101740 / IMI 381727 / IBT 21946) TaxID=767769 RepID=A0A1L9ULU8_ASPBC|nr:hypothetical protein ASPBRDRAFT_54372 [Aspergillus brasiliensis CBS 101740]